MVYTVNPDPILSPEEIDFHEKLIEGVNPSRIPPRIFLKMPLAREAIEKEINHTDEDRRPTRLRPFQENLDPNKCSPGNFSEIQLVYQMVLHKMTHQSDLRKTISVT